jgi:alpha-beta hydrolase superfamily lysophospholipase
VRNYGRTTGEKRGYLEELDELNGDIDKVVYWGRDKYGWNKTISMAGFSMGGALTLRFTTLNKNHKFSWVIFLNPGIKANPANESHLSIFDKIKIKFFPHTYLTPIKFL